MLAQIIETKLTEFFATKCDLKNRIGIRDLSLIISVNAENIFEYKLIGKEQPEKVELKEVIHLSIAEQFVTSNEGVEKILLKTITKYAEIEKESKETVSLVFTGKKTYFVRNKNNIFTKYDLQELLK